MEEWFKTPKETSADYEKALKPGDLLDLDSMIQTSLPNWSVVWQMIARDNNKRKGNPIERRSSKSDEKTSALQKKIQRKVHELLGEQEKLVNLYKEAAEVARVKEEAFRSKSVVLMEQIEKDRYFLRKLKDVR